MYYFSFYGWFVSLGSSLPNPINTMIIVWITSPESHPDLTNGVACHLLGPQARRSLQYKLANDLKDKFHVYLSKYPFNFLL